MQFKGENTVGFSTDAHCFACGYDIFLMLGGNRANHTTYAAWPVTCKMCAAVTTANFKQSPLTCQECDSGDVIPPIDPQWWKGDGDVNENWGMGRNALTLTNGHYRCPKCDEFELRFGTNAGNHAMIMSD
ncbi:hypothetical protein [Afipia birgiae]|uniref:hypothetical protein n=1 Tax=Afipia birgiae TaxID=151414 RepID=UPI0012ECA4E8|nr:hypothetical protein [Afipia birgiae]